MAKFKAEDCKNLQGQLAENENGTVFACTTPNCVDRKDCDEKIIDTPPAVHFEPLPSIEERSREVRESL